MMYLGVDLFEFILLGFAQVFELAGLCLLPDLRSFQPLFLQIYFGNPSLSSFGTLVEQMFAILLLS